MGLRARKQSLLTTIQALRISGKLSQEQANTFEMMYRRCRTQGEQDAVKDAIHHFLNGWRTDRGSAYAHLRRLREGIKLPEEQDEEESPEMQAALARSRVDVRRR